jgi:hypothetical protein
MEGGCTRLLAHPLCYDCKAWHPVRVYLAQTFMHQRRIHWMSICGHSPQNTRVPITLARRDGRPLAQTLFELRGHLVRGSGLVW